MKSCLEDRRSAHAYLYASIILCFLPGCDFRNLDGSGCAGEGDYVPLDSAHAELVIQQSAQQAGAEVDLTIHDGCGNRFYLSEGQGVSINGLSISESRDRGQYHREVPAAEEYELRIAEPTRGVEVLSLAPPALFEFVTPAGDEKASLSGFELTWTTAEKGVSVEVHLSQSLFGERTHTEIGPIDDTGTVTFSSEVLRPFRQGEVLEVTVVKSRQLSVAAGFDTLEVMTHLAQQAELEPGP